MEGLSIKEQHVPLIFACICLSACGISQEQKEKRQKVIDHTLENLVFVEGGTFTMGHPQLRTPGPAHEVELDSYSIMALEVSYWEYDTFTDETGNDPVFPEAKGDPERNPENAAWGVTWYGADSYCRWLGKISDLPFALPTEAQWEYAATSRGTSKAFYATDDGTLDYGRNYAGKNSPWYPEPSGQYPPNPLGLHDMTGNVTEWVSDWYNPSYYHNSPGQNPQGPDTGDLKIVRGGGVVGTQSFNILYRRGPGIPPEKEMGGFRCVINKSSPPQ